MNAIITPSNLIGSVNAPASKSVAHRMLICAALSDKVTTINCSTTSVDIQATVSCLNSLGASITETENGFTVQPIKKANGGATLNCRESGSTLRFMLSVAAIFGEEISFIGEGRLPQRPIYQLCDTLKAHGVEFSTQALPLTLSGRLTSGEYRIAANSSSQFISGLLLALPATKGMSKIITEGEIQSRPYIEITLDTLRQFGIETEFNDNIITVHESDGFISKGEYTVEGDWSNGAFFICGNGIKSNSIKTLNLNPSSKQGDKKIAEILGEFDKDETIIDVGDIPDLVPIMAVKASFSSGKTVFTNAARLKIKESDRLASTAKMINDLGGKAIAAEDSLTVFASPLRGGTVNACNDHRIVMSAAIAASGCQEAVIINGCEAVNKSYPTFFEDYKALGGKAVIE